jgi:hypothetical protein
MIQYLVRVIDLQTPILNKFHSFDTFGMAPMVLLIPKSKLLFDFVERIMFRLHAHMIESEILAGKIHFKSFLKNIYLY